MIPNRNVIAVLIFIAMPAWSAYAHEVEEETDKPLWSVGVGISFGNVYSQTSDTYYGLAEMAAASTGTALT